MASNSAQPPPTTEPSRPTASPTQLPPQPNATKSFDNPLMHNVALGVTPVAALAMFLPPRKLDYRLLVLGGVTIWGTNQLVYDYTSRSSAQRLVSRFRYLSGAELPEKAKVTQARLREEKELRRRRQQLAVLEAEASTDDDRRKIEELRRRHQQGDGGEDEEDSEQRGVLEKVWMGNAKSNWRKERDAKEKEALQEGGMGYWGLITEHISEAWPGARKKEGKGDGEKDNAREKGDTSKEEAEKK
ncbi:hypothetical protein F4778DRAFT_134027 [Xylariomycetidae sp. FL2044]|nr:hypothetical protein F4778DRAFT_134027 [Xylariomycetidae sp. FL2044]